MPLRLCWHKEKLSNELQKTPFLTLTFLYPPTKKLSHFFHSTQHPRILKDSVFAFPTLASGLTFAPFGDYVDLDENLSHTTSLFSKKYAPNKTITKEKPIKIIKLEIIGNEKTPINTPLKPSTP